jgi:Icc protein
MPARMPPISRRQFLAGSLAAGASLLVGRHVPAAEAQVPADPNRWVLLADTHVWEHRDRDHRGVKPAENLRQVIGEILALQPRPAGIILAGDSVYLEGHAADYAVLADLVQPLRQAGIPFHVSLGNHDNRENFWQAFPEAKPKGELPVPQKHVTLLETPLANWFLLDSLDKTNSTPGVLGEAQLRWLAGALDARADKPALVVAHHNPDAKAKVEGLRDTDALFKVLGPRKQVKAYVFGHTHRFELSCMGGIHGLNVPATAWLFDNAQPRGWIDVKLAEKEATLTLHALDQKHPAHGQTATLTWRS